MASLYKRGAHYYAQFNVGSRKKQFSLGTTRKDTAQKLLRRLETAYDERRWGPLAQHPDVVLRPSQPKEEPVPASLEERVERFLASRAHLAEKTQSNYRSVLGLLVAAGGSITKVIQGVSATSQHTYRTHLSAFYNWQIRQGWIEHNPCRHLVLQRKPQKRPLFFTKEEIDHLFAYVQQHADQRVSWWLAPMIVFVCYTGLRLKEVQALRWSWIDGPHILLPCNSTFRTKSGREEKVYVPPRAQDMLSLVQAAGQKGEHVFGKHRKEHISKSFLRWRRRSSLEAGSFHTLRHTCASWMAMKGCSPYVIQRHLRHSSIKVTEIYLHLSPSRHDELVACALE